jgi:hypothetical protein
VYALNEFFPRRVACDRVIWRKPLAFAVDAEGYKYIVWGFNGCFAISSPRSCELANLRGNLTCCTDAYYY